MTKINEINLRNLPFNNSQIKLSEITLFVGVNGSGKTTTMNFLTNMLDYNSNYCQLCNPSQVPIATVIIDENGTQRKISMIKVQNGIHLENKVSAPKLITLRLTDETPLNFKMDVHYRAKHDSPYSMAEFNNLVEDVNPLIKDIFNRTITKKYDDGVLKLYLKKENFDDVFIDPSKDGFGISSGLQKIVALLFTNASLVAIDEMCEFLHPSVIKKFLAIIFKICDKKKIQLIFSTHNPVVVTVFTEYLLNDNPNGKYGMNVFSINKKGSIDVEDIHHGNYMGSLTDFFSNFPDKGEIETMIDLKRPTIE